MADCCRTARHALAAIARARPGVFVTSVSKEIARYNTLATNAQTLNVNLNAHVLTRSKAEVGTLLRCGASILKRNPHLAEAK